MENIDFDKWFDDCLIEVSDFWDNMKKEFGIIDVEEFEEMDFDVDK